MLRSSQARHILNYTWLGTAQSHSFIIDVVGDDELDDSLEDEGNPSLENGNFKNLLILDDYEDEYDDEDDDDYVSGELWNDIKHIFLSNFVSYF